MDHLIVGTAALLVSTPAVFTGFGLGTVLLLGIAIALGLGLV